MVSGGETALIARAAAWGAGEGHEGSDTYKHWPQPPPAQSCRLSNWLSGPAEAFLSSPILRPCTPSSDLSPQLLLILLVLSPENELPSPCPFPPPAGLSGDEALPYKFAPSLCVSPPPPWTLGLPCGKESERDRHNLRTIQHISGARVLNPACSEALGLETGTSWMGESAGDPAGSQGWGFLEGK